MATAKKYLVKVAKNPEFCGIDAGGVQFAHGEAVVEDKRLVSWFKEHDGYEVSEAKAPAKTVPDKTPEGGQAGTD